MALWHYKITSIVSMPIRVGLIAKGRSVKHFFVALRLLKSAHGMN